MEKIFVLLNNSIRRLFGQTKTWLGVIIVLQLILLWLVNYVYLELSDSQYHFYMNTKNSLEHIHNVEIDSYDGDIAHKLSTEEKLIRRNNRRFHLKYLFK